MNTCGSAPVHIVFLCQILCPFSKYCLPAYIVSINSIKFSKKSTVSISHSYYCQSFTFLLRHTVVFYNQLFCPIASKIYAFQKFACLNVMSLISELHRSQFRINNRQADISRRNPSLWVLLARLRSSAAVLKSHPKALIHTLGETEKRPVLNMATISSKPKRWILELRLSKR